MLSLAGEYAAGVFLIDVAVVGDHHNGGAFLVEALEQLEDFICGFWVKVAGGFVGEDDIGVVEEGAGDGYALLLPAGELVGHLVGLCSHSHGFEDLRDPGIYAGALLPAGGPQDKLKVVFHGAVREQLEVLENHAKFTPKVGDVLAAEFPEVVSAGLSFTAEETVFRGDRANDGGFAGANLANYIHKVSGHDVHVEAVKHYTFSVEDVGVLEVNERFHKDYSKSRQR